LPGRFARPDVENLLGFEDPSNLPGTSQKRCSRGSVNAISTAAIPEEDLRSLFDATILMLNLEVHSTGFFVKNAKEL